MPVMTYNHVFSETQSNGGGVVTKSTLVFGRMSLRDSCHTCLLFFLVIMLFDFFLRHTR